MDVEPVRTHILDDIEAEEQPLLPSVQRPTPLPKCQLFIACFARLAKPVAFSQIFPYINQMVEELHVTDNPAEIGFYSGLIDGLFAMAELITVYQWGSLSDRIGRKPTVIAGLTGLCIAIGCFGLSTKYWHILIFRALAGAFSGNVAVIQSIFSDITDETNHSKAVPLANVAWCIGATFGPLIGGMLSHPAERYPALFGNMKVFVEHPFLLPCLVSASIALLAIVFSVLFLEEAMLPFKSLPRIVAARQSEITKQVEAIPRYGSTPGPLTPPQDGAYIPPTTRELLSNKRFSRALLAAFFNAFICFGWYVDFILWVYTPISLGGLERTPAEIGFALSCMSIWGIGMSTLGFPALHRRFGTLPLYTTTAILWAVTFTIILFTGIVSRGVLHAKAGVAPPLGPLWIGVALILIAANLAIQSFSVGFLVIKETSPDIKSLGAVFGLAETVGAIGEATSPAIFSSLFAFSVDRQVLGGNFVWLVLIAVSVVGLYVTRSIKYC